MYAIVATGGKQYKVREGEILRIEKIPGEVGSPVSFDQVLMVADGDTVSIGRPALEGAAVASSSLSDSCPSRQALCRRCRIFGALSPAGSLR